ERLSLCGLWRAIVLRDREGMRDRAAELGVQAPGGPQNPVPPPRERLSLCGLWRAIVLRDREGMRDRAAELGVQDWLLFSEMLLQRPLSRRSRLLAAPGAHLEEPLAGAHLRGAPEGHLSAAERGYMQSMAARRFPQVLQVLRALPRPMLLVFRNINTVRSVHGALGAPADRYGIMARR
ncbi:uncharacterized aarF domain-containing protein kinase 5-like, partial [Passer montanus]|uniref:uncharacterized aarF domain-containing protein kinase 5-like n=1 Tax=Passer montanus TaxID=9160 RepID=UPI00196107D5